MLCIKHDSRVDWCHIGLPSHPTVFTSDELKYWNVLMTCLLPHVSGQWKLLNILYPSLLPLTVCSLLTCVCVCVDCRIWGRPARRSGQAIASCPLWRRWLSQSIPTTTCESALERYSQTKALTSWTSRILVLFHTRDTTLHLTHAALHLNCTTVSLTVVFQLFSVSVCMWL